MANDAIEEIEGSSGSVSLRTTEEENVMLCNESIPNTSPVDYTRNIETVYINPTQNDKIIIISCTDDDGREQLLGVLIKENDGGYFGLNCEIITNGRKLSGGSGGTALYGVEVYSFSYHNSNNLYIRLRQNVDSVSEYANVYTVRKYYYK